jgi:hypothetical protein
MALAALCLARARRTSDPAPIKHGCIAHCREGGNQVCHPQSGGAAFAGVSAVEWAMQIPVATGERIMASYGPELIQIMRAVLDEVMTKIPMEQVTPGVKAHMAEVILKAAAQGQTSYDALLASASDQIQAILSLLS